MTDCCSRRLKTRRSGEGPDPTSGVDVNPPESAESIQKLDIKQEPEVLSGEGLHLTDTVPAGDPVVKNEPFTDLPAGSREAGL